LVIIIERPHQKWWGFFMSTRITDGTGGMLFGNANQIILISDGKVVLHMPIKFTQVITGEIFFNKVLTNIF